MTRPRRSARITGLHSYHKAVRPCATHRYSSPRGCCRSDRSLSRQTPMSGAGHRIAAQVPTFPIEAQVKLAPPPCRTPPGQSAGTRQAHHGPELQARFRCHLPVSTRRQWFTHVRLLDPHLTRSQARRLPQRSPPRLLTAAACGGLRPPPAGRPRRVTRHQRRAPSSSMQHRISNPSFYIESPLRSWHTTSPALADTSVVAVNW